MTKLLKTAAALICAVTLTACNEEHKGQMTVHIPLQLNASKGKVIDVPAGSFATKVGISKDKLKIEVKDAAGKMRKIEMKHGLKDKNINEVLIPGAQSGQPYDVLARRTVSRNTDVIDSGSDSCTVCVSHREVCGYEGGGQDCDNVTECNPNDPGQCKTRQVCRDIDPVYTCNTVCDRYHYGMQDWTKYRETKITSVQVILKNAMIENAAQFDAQKVDVDTRTSLGGCN